MSVTRQCLETKQQQQDSCPRALTEMVGRPLLEVVALSEMNPPLDEEDMQRAMTRCRVIADWLEANDSTCQMGGDAAATAQLIRQEACK